jgi:uncharacterized protein (TIGR03437 family)
MATGLMGWSTPGGQGLNFPCVFTERADSSVEVTSLNQTAPVRFNDLDLYLMGLITPAEVRTQYLVTDPAKIAAAIARGCSGLGTLAPAEYRKIGAADLAEVNGARNPPASASQKDFRSIHLVLSRDALLSPEEMSFFDVMARRSEEAGAVPVNVGRLPAFGYPWAAATQGKSRLSAKLTTDALPTVSYGGVVNAGSFLASGLGPGAVSSLFGSDLAGATESAVTVPLPTKLAGIRVLVNGRPAPLFYASPNQINFQLPTDLSTSPVERDDPAYLASISVERDGAISSNLAFAEILASAPGLMTYGARHPVAVAADGSLIGPDNPATAGTTITVFWVGSAPLSERVPAGAAAPVDRLVRVTAPATVTINGMAQTVDFLGLSPGGVGLLQANVTLSTSLSSGTFPLVLTIGGRASNAVNLAVRR